MFSLLNATWTPLKPMKESRSRQSSVVHNNQIFVMGGVGLSEETIKSIEKLSLNAVQVDQSITWENVLAVLPEPLCRHCSVVYNGRLLVIGGYYYSKCACSDSITEISLVPPSTSKLPCHRQDVIRMVLQWLVTRYSFLEVGPQSWTVAQNVQAFCCIILLRMNVRS